MSKNKTRPYELLCMSRKGKVLTVQSRDYVLPTEGPEIIACRVRSITNPLRQSWFKWPCEDWSDATNLSHILRQRTGAKRVTFGNYGPNRTLITCFYTDQIVFDLAMTLLANNCKRAHRYRRYRKGFSYV